MVFILDHTNAPFYLLVLVEHRVAVLISSHGCILGVGVRVIAFIDALVDLSLAVEELPCRLLFPLFKTALLGASFKLVFDIDHEMLLMNVRLKVLVLVVLHGVLFGARFWLVSAADEELVEDLEELLNLVHALEEGLFLVELSLRLTLLLGL